MKSARVRQSASILRWTRKRTRSKPVTDLRCFIHHMCNRTAHSMLVLDSLTGIKVQIKVPMLFSLMKNGNRIKITCSIYKRTENGRGSASTFVENALP